MVKVWIASILATLMLVMPITNVVSANEIDDCNCNPISDSQVVRIERLLDKVENRINFILLKYGHIPEVKDKCEEILDIIHSNIVLDYPIICAFLLILYRTLSSLVVIFDIIILNHETLYLIFFPILFPIGLTLILLMIMVEIRGIQLNCEGFHIP